MITICNEPPILVAPRNVGINVSTYRGTGSPLDKSTLKGAEDMAQAVVVLLCKHKVLSSSSSTAKRKKKNWGIKMELTERVSAQHVQGPGFNSPALLNKKKW
jgi:hypothetical protein